MWEDIYSGKVLLMFDDRMMDDRLNEYEKHYFVLNFINIIHGYISLIYI
jgi:hypothetical protein